MSRLPELKVKVFELMDEFPELLSQHMDESQMTDLERFFVLFLTQVDREVSKWSKNNSNLK